MVYKTGVSQGTNSEPLDIYLLLSFSLLSSAIQSKVWPNTYSEVPNKRGALITMYVGTFFKY